MQSEQGSSINLVLTDLLMPEVGELASNLNIALTGEHLCGSLWCMRLAGPFQSLMCTFQVDGMQLIDALQKEEYQDVPIIGEHQRAQCTRLTSDVLTLPANSLHCRPQMGAAL